MKEFIDESFCLLEILGYDVTQWQSTGLACMRPWVWSPAPVNMAVNGMKALVSIVSY